MDIIFRDQHLETAMVGGAMLNTAVSLGRLHMPAFLISEWGNDGVGEITQNFLTNNAVNTSFCKSYHGNTSLSVALIDTKGNASYTFYKNYPEKRFQIDTPDFEPGDFVLFGSLFSIDPGIRTQMTNILKQARNSGALLIYDPNFRKNHLASLEQLLPFIEENIRYSHIIRGSHEDFHYIYRVDSCQKLFEKVHSLGCEVLIITHGSDEILLFKECTKTRVAAAAVEAVSTIGAGDSFNAGLMYELYRRQISPNNLNMIPSCEWAEIVSVASSFAANTCSHYENYISQEFAQHILSSQAI